MTPNVRTSVKRHNQNMPPMETKARKANRMTLRKVLEPYLNEKNPGQGFAAKVGSVTIAYLRKVS